MLRGVIIAIAALAAATPALGQTRLFEAETPLTIVIDAPFPTIVRNMRSSVDPHPASLTVTDGSGPAQTVALQVAARGNSRRTEGYCQFPPIALVFGEKPPLRGTPFQAQEKLKLVTHCRGDAGAEQRAVLEYLAYRLYNVITPLSHKVRAARITYRTGPSDAGVTKFGFLIEDIDDVAERNDLEELKAASGVVRVSQMDNLATARATMFELMIANTDWALFTGPPGEDCCHNSNFLGPKGSEIATARGLIPVPYDFDLSGLVEQPYAGPQEGVPVSRVTDRYYRGYCFTNAETAAVVAEFMDKRAALMAVVTSDPLLNPQFKTRATRFLEGFFTSLNSPARVQELITNRCRRTG